MELIQKENRASKQIPETFRAVKYVAIDVIVLFYKGDHNERNEGNRIAFFASGLMLNELERNDAGWGLQSCPPPVLICTALHI